MQVTIGAIPVLKKVLLSWSSGKDSAWALRALRRTPGIEVVALLTNFNSRAGRVSMHAVRRELVELQAESAGLPLWNVELPWPCSNSIYEDEMRAVCRRAVSEGIEAIAFGDLFLEEVRTYRIRQLAATGLEPLFPIWGLPTDSLAEEMLDAGIRAAITCLDPAKIDASHAGGSYDRPFLDGLPSSVDPCGENGEFHTFAWDAPVFSHPIPVRAGEVRTRDGFVFADLLPA